jgi:arginyl-tRNA synthetase
LDPKAKIAELLETAARSYLASAEAHSVAFSVQVEEPKNKEFGDYASNLALQLAGKMKKPPMEIARAILEHLPKDALIARANAQPPGFINFVLAKDSATEILRRIATADEAFGKSDVAAGKKALVEFVSANPTGPLHIGHARNAVVGDSLARILEAVGYSVSREYYYNDAGLQMRKLGESLRARYLQLLGVEAALPEDGYQGDYMIDIAKKLLAERADALKDSQDIDFFTRYAAGEILELIKDDFEKLGITFDNWYSESSLHREGKVDSTIARLQTSADAYEEDGAWWLRSSKYGDEKDRVLIKRGGEKTYLAPDIAYHETKFQRGYDLMVNVLGGDHHGYVPRLRAGIQAIGCDPERLHCIIIQMVTLLKDGMRTKLSTRRGEFITIKQMVDELGRDVVRFFFLMRTTDSQLVFDWELAKDTSMNNPVYYVQYAYARFCSLFKKAAERGIAWRGIQQCDLTQLDTAEEQDIIRALARYPEVVRKAAETLEPSLIASYLREVAGLFHQYFTMGTKDEELRVLALENDALTQARLALIHSLRIVIGNGLRLLGISTPDHM